MRSPRPRGRNASKAPGGARMPSGNLARDYFRVEDGAGHRFLDLPRRALSRHRRARLVPARTVRVSIMRYVEFASYLEFLLPARRLAPGGADGAGGEARARWARSVRPQQRRRRGARACGQARERLDACATIPARAWCSPTARRTFSPIRATALAGEGCAGCSRSATAAPQRATAQLDLRGSARACRGAGAGGDRGALRFPLPARSFTSPRLRGEVDRLSVAKAVG